MTLIKRIYKRLFAGKAENNNTSIIKDWQKAGKPLPPPHPVKQTTINDLKKKFKYETFVETGTYLGQMVESQKDNFRRIFSIELGEKLYLDAVKKFENDKNVNILHGDSGDVLIELCAKLNEPAIFWLDGHYSAGITAKGKKLCPIYEELLAIFNSTPLSHILLIDDARLFIGENDYPTIPELSEFVKKHRPHSEIYCKDDMIHVFI
jgi:hypothetical protein